ncbi:hypothetical protein G7Y79_00036g071920 [Physcia stellaris]|nr:hypothetical protein G7Y79_00036g071920 [Physcia stellaris]
MAEPSTAEAPSTEPQARKVLYCGVCTLPPEVHSPSSPTRSHRIPELRTTRLMRIATPQYCEFGGTAKKCREWLEAEYPEMHEKLYSEEAISAHLSTLSVDAQKRAQKDSAKKEAKALQQEKRAAEEKAGAKVLIKRVERNKRKYVTAVSGLEAHGLDLKKVAKEWGKKFATGSSVTKSAGGTDEIVVQGDNSDEIFDWVTEVGNVPEDNVDMIEDKKKKAG